MTLLNNLKTAFLLGSLMGLCMLVGYLVLGGPMGLAVGLLVGGLGNLITFFFSDKIAIAAMQGQPIERNDLPWLYDGVQNMASDAGLPMPRLYVCPQAAPNAFATGRNPRNAAVAVTQGMLQNFRREEILAVLAHELAHVRHRDTLISTIAATMAGLISYAGYMLMWFGGGRNSRDNPLGLVGTLALVLLAPIAAMLIQMAISRQREYAADAYGGALCGNPLHLAAALERLGRLNERIPTETNPAFHNLYIVEPLHDGIGNLFSTHPPLEKRIAALQQQAAQRGYL